MKIFDTHAHYDDEKFDEDRDAVIDKIQKSGVEKCINVGCSIQGTKNSIELSEKYDFMYAMCGIHPSEIENEEQKLKEQLSQIKEMALNSKKTVAIGEIGLDYYWESNNKEEQKKAFLKQIQIANELKLPIAIHTREAIDDTIKILKENKIDCGGVLHCCPFNKFLVQAGLNAGLHIAFGGTCTFKSSKNAEEIVKMVPLERMLIETDSPFLSPEPVRGTRNDSSNLKYVIEKLAQFKECSAEEIAEITYQNACKLFQIGG